MPDSDSDPSSVNCSAEAFVELVPGPPVQGTIRPPGSKSLTNRALICAAFARGRSVLTGALRSEDTEVMIEALRKTGVTISVSDGGRRLEVDGSTRQVASSQSDTIDLYIANSGTTVRFLTAALSAAGGNYRIHGVPRMHQRPIRDLVTAIESVIDGKIQTESAAGCPPVLLACNGWQGTDLQVAGSVSSQYLSGLMMAAPIQAAARNPTSGSSVPIRIAVIGELVSRPYVDMTAAVMRSFGARLQIVSENLPDEQTVRFDVDPGGYVGTELGSNDANTDELVHSYYAIEPDASAASYFWAAAAITGGTVTVEGLSQDAMQGDVGFCEVLESMGCEIQYDSDSITVKGNSLRGVDVNMNVISDTVQTLAVVALFATGPTRVRGVAHNRYKETDRIGDLACELRKLGATVAEHEDGLTITPPASGIRGATLETYHDHRMAMSLSLVGLRVPNVRILDPACTSKTYPDFFADLEKLIGRAHLWA